MPQPSPAASSATSAEQLETSRSDPHGRRRGVGRSGTSGRTSRPGRRSSALLLALSMLLTATVATTVTPRPAEATSGEAPACEPENSEPCGSADNPYLIATLEDLIWVRDETNNSMVSPNWSAGKHFKQTADINLITITDWDPIGRNPSGKHFQGVYNGDGHSIRNLRIPPTSPTQNHVGLFGRVSRASGHPAPEIKNLRVENVAVHGGSWVAGLVGLMNDGSIEDVAVTGIVEATGDYVGGIAGQPFDTSMSNRVVFVGEVHTTSTTAQNVGGLAGRTSGETDVSVAYARGIVTGGRWPGGLIGNSSGGQSDFSSMYSAMTVCLSRGALTTDGPGAPCESTVSGDRLVGAVVGRIQRASDNIADTVFWDTSLTTAMFGSQDGTGGDRKAIGLTTAQMQGEGALGSDPGQMNLPDLTGDPAGPWRTVSRPFPDYPVFDWQIGVPITVDVETTLAPAVASGTVAGLTVVAQSGDPLFRDVVVEPAELGTSSVDAYSRPTRRIFARATVNGLPVGASIEPGVLDPDAADPTFADGSTVTLALAPHSITVSSLPGATDVGWIVDGGELLAVESGATLRATTLLELLLEDDLTIVAGEDIIFAATLTSALTGGSDRALTLRAGRDVALAEGGAIAPTGSDLDLTIVTGSAGDTGRSFTLGEGATIAVGNGDVTIVTDVIVADSSATITSPGGALRIRPADDSRATGLATAAPGGLEIPASAVAGPFAHVLIGSPDTAGAITVGSYPAATTLTLHTGGPVTQTGSITGRRTLTILDSSAVVLDEVNDVSALVADGVGQLTFVNGAAMQLGPVDASGPVDVRTVTGDLTIVDDVETADASTSALLLAAATSAEPGDVESGDVVLQSGDLATGDGGTARVFTGGFDLDAWEESDRTFFGVDFEAALDAGVGAEPGLSVLFRDTTDSEAIIVWQQPTEFRLRIGDPMPVLARIGGAGGPEADLTLVPGSGDLPSGIDSDITGTIDDVEGVFGSYTFTVEAGPDKESDLEPVRRTFTVTVSHLDMAEIVYEDTVAFDRFADVTISIPGRISSSLPGSPNDRITDVTGFDLDGETPLVLEGTPGGLLPDAPNTAAIRYDRAVRTELGDLFIRRENESGDARMVFIPNDETINTLGAGQTASVTFGITMGWNAIQPLTVTAIGAADAPEVQLSRRDDLTRKLPGPGDEDFFICNMKPAGEVVGNPYRILTLSRGTGGTPDGERCHSAFDGLTATKYLNAVQSSGSSPVLNAIAVDMQERVLVTEIQLSTANDSPDRDPVKVTILGSNRAFPASLGREWTTDEREEWVDLANWEPIGTFDLSDADGPLLIGEDGQLLPASERSARFTDYQTVTFENSQPYRYYRISFPEVRSGNTLQVSRIRLGGGTESFAPTHVAGQAGVAVEPSATLRRVDADGTDALSGFTVTVVNCEAGDTLSLDAALPAGVTSTSSSGGCTLTVSGEASLDAYTPLLQQVRFATDTSAPDDDREVTWSVTDSRGVTTAPGSLSSVVRIITGAALDGLDDDARVDQPIAFDPIGSTPLSDTLLPVAVTPSFVPVTLASTTTDVCALTGGQVRLLDVGTCTLRATVDTTASIFRAAEAEVSFTVTRAPLTVRALDVTRTAGAGGLTSSFEVVYEGLLADHPASTLGGSLTFTGSALGATAPGTYTIVPGGLASTRYLITFVPGTLTLVLAPPAPPAPVAPPLPTAPVATPGGTPPAPTPAPTARIGDTPVPITATPAGTVRQEGTTTVSTATVLTARDVSLALDVTGAGDVRTAPGGSPQVRVARDTVAQTSGSGMLPDTRIAVWLPRDGSDGRRITLLDVAADGTFSGTLPFDGSGDADTDGRPLPIGRQVLQLVGVDADGELTIIEQTVTITQPGPAPEPDRAAGAPPALNPGASIATNAGLPETVTVIPRPDVRQARVQSDDGTWAMAVDIPSADGRVAPTADGGALIELVADDVASVSGEGFMPTTRADVWLFSTPTLLGSVTIGIDGTFTGEVAIDGEAIALGEHTLQLQGVGTDGYVRAANLGVLVVPAAAPPSDDADEGPGSPDAAPEAADPDPDPAPAPDDTVEVVIASGATGGTLRIVLLTLAGVVAVIALAAWSSSSRRREDEESSATAR